MKNLFLLFSLLIFISSCEKKGIITYPETGVYGDNILSINQTVYSSEVSLTADMTRNSHLKVRIEPYQETTSFGLWSYDPFSNKFLIISDYENNIQTFESEKSKGQVYLSMNFNPGKYIVTIQENRTRVMPRVKEIVVK